MTVERMRAFAAAAGEKYNFSRDALTAVGYSNGANIAAAR